MKSADPAIGGDPEVELLHWNPRRPRFRGPLRRLPITAPVNNFGDLLGPEIVRGVRRELGLSTAAEHPARLWSIGSVLHLARDGDVVWGSGVNGKVPVAQHAFRSLDVRAVRGPLTERFLRDRGVLRGPVAFGDPGLLLGRLRPDLLGLPRDIELTIVPNLNDLADFSGDAVMSPRLAVERCLQRIARSRLVIGSSLHGIIVAEALGVPARAMGSRTETPFKYADYFTGTGRTDYRIAETVDEALRLGGEAPPAFSEADLLDAFPAELWRSGGSAARWRESRVPAVAA